LGEKSFDEFTFTADDVQKTHDLLREGSEGSQVSTPTLSIESGALTGGAGAVPSEEKRQYDRLRAGVDSGKNLYRVANPTLNVRLSMSTNSEQIAELAEGDVLDVTDIPNAGWAKVKLADGRDGFASFRYLAKITTDEKLPGDKKQFENTYFVNFDFVNVRKDPNTQAEKIGEFPRNALLKPLSIAGKWARVKVDGKEGYVSMDYLDAFEPTFLVRQDAYDVPILRYSAQDVASINALGSHVAALSSAGKRVVSLSALYDIVLQQELKDVRVPPNTVVLVVTDVTAGNIRAVSDALLQANVDASLFVSGKDVGIAGISEKTMLNLLANGFDVQSGAHTGDDLRALTDTQLSLELAQSKKLIEEQSHKGVFAVFYPKGGVNDRVMQKAADAGYLFGISEVPGTHFARSEFLTLPSQTVTGSFTANDVVALVK
jgi:uncharacterized protein YgiM (DUF1202 family)